MSDLVTNVPEFGIGIDIIRCQLFFISQIDEVRIWDDARTQSEIRANMHAELSGSESNLVAYYKMSNGSGTSLTDNSSNSNTGTLTNMDGSTDWVTSYAPMADLTSGYTTDIEAIWSGSSTSASDASDGLTMTVSSALSTGDFAVYGNNNTSGTSTHQILVLLAVLTAQAVSGR